MCSYYEFLSELFEGHEQASSEVLQDSSSLLPYLGNHIFTDEEHSVIPKLGYARLEGLMKISGASVFVDAVSMLKQYSALGWLFTQVSHFICGAGAQRGR